MSIRSRKRWIFGSAINRCADTQCKSAHSQPPRKYALIRQNGTMNKTKLLQTHGSKDDEKRASNILHQNDTLLYEDEAQTLFPII